MPAKQSRPAFGNPIGAVDAGGGSYAFHGYPALQPCADMAPSTESICDKSLRARGLTALKLQPTRVNRKAIACWALRIDRVNDLKAHRRPFRQSCVHATDESGFGEAQQKLWYCMHVCSNVFRLFTFKELNWASELVRRRHLKVFNMQLLTLGRCSMLLCIAQFNDSLAAATKILKICDKAMVSAEHGHQFLFKKTLQRTMLAEFPEMPWNLTDLGDGPPGSDKESCNLRFDIRDHWKSLKRS